MGRECFYPPHSNHPIHILSDRFLPHSEHVSYSYVPVVAISANGMRVRISFTSTRCVSARRALCAFFVSRDSFPSPTCIIQSSSQAQSHTARAPLAVFVALHSGRIDRHAVSRRSQATHIGIQAKCTRLYRRARSPARVCVCESMYLDCRIVLPIAPLVRRSHARIIVWIAYAVDFIIVFVGVALTLSLFPYGRM